MAWNPESPLLDQTLPQPLALSGLATDEAPLLMKALNRDNIREAEKLVELFHKHYGNEYYQPLVFNPEYWCASEELVEADADDFLSLRLERAGEFLAHIAIRFHRQTFHSASGVVEASHLAVDPRYRRELFKLGQVFGNCLEDHARRQQWELLFSCAPSHEISWQMVTTRCFSFSETAILPIANKNTGRLLACRAFCEPDRPAVLYPPKKHFEIIDYLYRSLPGEHFFDVGDEKSTQQLELAFPNDHADSSTIELFPEGRLSFLNPLDEKGNLIQLPRFEPEITSIVACPLDHPSSPVLADVLEAAGLKFCGVLPHFGRRHFSLYLPYRGEDVRNMELAGKHSRYLRDYLLNS